jgi:hypothetical protein
LTELDLGFCSVEIVARFVVGSSHHEAKTMMFIFEDDSHEAEQDIADTCTQYLAVSRTDRRRIHHNCG